MINVGDLLDNTYKILESIGSGGSGVIFKAYHSRLKKFVVIKMIKEELLSAINIRIEADILKNLKHSYLPQVYDFIVSGNDVYTVMEYIPGENLLSELNRRKRFSQKRVVKWSIQLCEALSHLHNKEKSIIHSDIKPSNIMLTPDDDICLIDFNVSMLLNSSNSVIGFSEGYSSPELLSCFNAANRMIIPLDKANEVKISPFSQLNSGKSTSNIHKAMDRLDCRADIYSLGATMYHLLSGEKPSSTYNNIKSLNSYGIRLDKSLMRVVSKAMQINIDDRYPNIDYMLQDLKNIDFNHDSFNNVFKTIKSRLNIKNNGK